MLTLPDILRSVRRVEVKTTRLVNDMMVGAWLSRFKGRGLDFEELREYLPGDDVRDMDWNVTRRLGRPFVRKFREERELTVILAVDISASSRFGSGPRSAREASAEIAATLAFSAARNGDKVGLLLFSDTHELLLPPRKGRRHLLRLVRELLFHPARGRGTDVPAALSRLNHALPRRAIVFLITDFLQADAGRTGRTLAHEIGLTRSRHDLVCVHLHDPRAARLPEAGLATLEDAETGELIEVDTAPLRTRDTYARANAERLGALDRTLNQAGVDVLRLTPGEPFAAPLQRFFETRRRRRA